MCRSSAKADTVPTDLDSSRKKKATQVSLMIMKYILTPTFKYNYYISCCAEHCKQVSGKDAEILLTV